MMMRELLFSAVKEGSLRDLDVQFAMMMASNEEPAVMLATAILSKDSGEGHICLPIDRLVQDDNMPSSLQSCFALVGQVDWRQILLRSHAVSEGDCSTPLILRGGRLYLNRMWQSEKTIARFFSENALPIAYDEVFLKKTLNSFFGTEESVKWQKVAAAVALTRRVSVISGGPGTGKTTTVSKLLAALIQITREEKYRIRLVAPTGKAASRLSKAINDSLHSLPVTEAERQLFPKEATTLHALLGKRAGSQRLTYHAGNLLHLDVLVVDEASMVDLPMMSCLIQALPPHARVIFLGDRDQLASVEAGAVLGDICIYATKGYTVSRANELAKLTGYSINGDPNPIAGVLRDSICFLKKNYRFGTDSGIWHCAEAVKKGDYPAIQAIFSSTFSDIRRTILQTNEDYLRMLEEVMEYYLSFLRCVQRQDEPQKVLRMFSQFQLLCAFREGPFGVEGLNKRLEYLLSKTGNINRHLYSQWYGGRPVMISRNDSFLKLANGDIGVALEYGGQGLRVWFQMSDGKVKSVHPSRLPKHETSWAITVNKSQGSEFKHVALILPVNTTPLVTRELLYTAITRARNHLSLYANDRVLMEAVETRTQRRSGLPEIFNSL